MRQLSATDAREMAVIHAQSFERSWDALEMATHTQRDLCLGADHKGALAGFIIVSTPADQAEILTLATAKTARRQGLARLLLNETTNQLRQNGVKEVFLEVAEDNLGALALYKYAGFQPIGRRPGYYRREGGRVAAMTFSKKV